MRNEFSELETLEDDEFLDEAIDDLDLDD